VTTTASVPSGTVPRTVIGSKVTVTQLGA
jgi:hypothetical protein